MIRLQILRCLGCGTPFSSCGVRLAQNPVCSRRGATHPLIRLYARGSQRVEQQETLNPLLRYIRTLRWVPIPLGVGFAYISYKQYGNVVKREEKKLQDNVDPEELLATDWVVRLYQCVPLKILSRLWGAVNNMEVPVSMRSPFYRGYSRAFGCNIEEAAIRDLTHYRNLSEFFRRRLRPGVRPIDPKSLITCPSDGIVMHFGKADLGLVEQVKGITYSLQEFLGPKSSHDLSSIQGTMVPNLEPGTDGPMSRINYPKRLKKCQDNELYHCIFYLSPGDYHGFHSPTEWLISHRRHFPGELFSVNPGVARLVRGLFNLNERAVYVGHYKHGFFAMVAVAATNVGNIKVYHDKHLSTNEPYRYAEGTYLDESYEGSKVGGIPMKKGEAFGEFNLGSTIVLVFEAPKDFQFDIKPGQQVKYGQAVGSVPDITK